MDGTAGFFLLQDKNLLSNRVSGELHKHTQNNSENTCNGEGNEAI
jgi:hypothetical protein